MSLQNVEAQLGNLLSAMPLKLQKVSPTFLDTATPPFEGAMASDAQGQFYVSDFNDQGELSWKQIIDNTARQAAAGESNSEVVLQYDLPVGFESSTITFGKTLTGSQFSAFVQYEPPGGDDMTMYVFAVKNITSTQFDLHVSDTIGEAGGKLHIFAKGYSSSGAGSSGGDSSNDGDSSGGSTDSPAAPEVTRQSELVAWWKLNEAVGSNTYTESISGYDASQTNSNVGEDSPPHITGPATCGITGPNLNGSIQSVDFDLDPLNACSISYWTKPTEDTNSPSANQTGHSGAGGIYEGAGAVSVGGLGTSWSDYNFRFGPLLGSDQFKVELIGDGNDSVIGAYADPSFNPGEWANWIITWSSGNPVKVYRNGTKILESTAPYADSPLADSNCHIYLGGSINTSPTVGFKYSDVRVYSVELAGVDAANIWNNGEGDIANTAENSAPEPTPTLSDVIDMSPEFWWNWGDSYSDASATTPAAGGDLVMSVADQSSNNRILLAQNAGYAPQLQTNGANGQPYVDSGAGNCRFRWVADADISGPACIYMVMKDYTNANSVFWSNSSSGASFYNYNTDGTAPDIFRTTFGSDGNYGAAVLTPEIKIYQVYAGATEVGIRVNGGAIHPHWAPSETITPVVENFASTGDLMYLPFGAKVHLYEFGFIPDVTHDQDKVFRYLGDKYDIDVTDVS
jgi:hypothetical protein